MNAILLSLALVCAATDPVETSQNPETLLYVRTTPAGAEIVLDGKPLGTSDGLFPVNSGDYKIVVNLEDYQPEEQQITVRDGRITRIELTLKKAAATVPDQPTSGFGPVVERVVGDDRYGKDWLLDLDSGRLITPPRELDPEQNPKADIKEFMVWAKKQGVDVSGIKASQGVLVGVELDAAIVKATWENVTAEAIHDALKQIDPRVVASRLRESEPMTVLGGEHDSETIYAFKTREGGVGALQVLGVTEDGHGTKVRYKLGKREQPRIWSFGLDGISGTEDDVRTRSQESDKTRISNDGIGDLQRTTAKIATHEATINDLDEGQGNEAIDLDGHRQYDLTENAVDRSKGPGPKAWTEQNGVDLLVEYANNRWALAAADLTLKRYLPNEFWDRLGPAEIQVLISLDAKAGQDVEILDRAGFRYYILDRHAKPPITFAFKTSKGSLGVLQVVEFLEKPRRVKIRYRVVHTERNGGEEARSVPSTERVPDAPRATDPDMVRPALDNGQRKSVEESGRDLHSVDEINP